MSLLEWILLGAMLVVSCIAEYYRADLVVQRAWMDEIIENMKRDKA